MRFVEGGVATPKGYAAAACHCGIRSNPNAKDLALVFSERPATVAGVFTTNRVASACVTVSRKVVEAGSARAIVANSGCANTCMGAKGLRDAEEMARVAAEALEISPDEVIVASTGVIGTRLPIVKVCEGIENLADQLSKEMRGNREPRGSAQQRRRRGRSGGNTDHRYAFQTGRCAL